MCYVSVLIYKGIDIGSIHKTVNTTTIYSIHSSIMKVSLLLLMVRLQAERNQLCTIGRHHNGCVCVFCSVFACDISSVCAVRKFAPSNNTLTNWTTAPSGMCVSIVLQLIAESCIVMRCCTSLWFVEHRASAIEKCRRKCKTIERRRTERGDPDDYAIIS